MSCSAVSLLQFVLMTQHFLLSRSVQNELVWINRHAIHCNTIAHNAVPANT